MTLIELYIFLFYLLFNYSEKQKADKTFGFSFVSLMRPDGTTVPDDTHDLCVYKVKCVIGPSPIQCSCSQCEVTLTAVNTKQNKNLPFLQVRLNRFLGISRCTCLAGNKVV